MQKNQFRILLLIAFLTAAVSCRKYIKKAYVKGTVINLVTRKPVDSCAVQLNSFNDNWFSSKNSEYIERALTGPDGRFEFELRTRKAKRFNYYVYAEASSFFSNEYYLGNKILNSLSAEARNTIDITKKGESAPVLCVPVLAGVKIKAVNSSPVNAQDTMTVWATSEGFEDIIFSNLGRNDKTAEQYITVPAGETIIKWVVTKNNTTYTTNARVMLRKEQMLDYTITY